MSGIGAVRAEIKMEGLVFGMKEAIVRTMQDRTGEMLKIFDEAVAAFDFDGEIRKTVHDTIRTMIRDCVEEAIDNPEIRQAVARKAGAALLAALGDG